MPGADARTRLAGTRFADVRWVAETGSTNADVLALARAGEPEGLTVVADHQSAGRGRRGRTWVAPPEAGLLFTVLLRPPAAVAQATTMAAGLAVAAGIEAETGVVARVKWPNDLVWPGGGSAPDRKLCGILAEADWPAGSDVASGHRQPGPGERVAVAVGIGINVRWPDGAPDELADTSVALEEVGSGPVDREALLVAVLRALDQGYTGLLAEGAGPLVEAWRARSATIGRRVRVDLGAEDVEGTAVDVTGDGRLVVETVEGERRTLAVGDVVHLRPT